MYNYVYTVLIWQILAHFVITIPNLPQMFVLLVFSGKVNGFEFRLPQHKRH